MNEQPEESVLDRILKRIPGFGGYVDQKVRQENDEKTRRFVTDQLQTSKTDLDRFAKQLVDALRIDDVAQWEALRDEIDSIIQRLRSQLPGSSSFFGLSDIDEDRLEDLYDCDANLMDYSVELSDMTKGLSSESTLVGVKSAVEKLQTELSKRTRIQEEIS